MKIGFQAAVIDDNQTGLGIYAKNLLSSFAGMNKLDQIWTIHYAGRNADFYADKQEVLIPEFPFRLSKIFGVPAAVRKCHPDLLHFPVHRCDDFLSYFMNARVKKILTIHDLIPFISPPQQDLQTRYLWTTTLKIIHRNLSVVIVDSESTLNDCVTYLRIPRENIRVIPLAASDIFKPDQNREEVSNRVLVDLGIDVPFIFYTGSLIPRKNIPLLLKAFSLLKRKGYPHKLVIAGGKNSYFRDLIGIAENLGISGEIIFPGYLAEQDLVDYYNAAEIFVYPSLYEGFGIPPLEAMACGTPVVTSNTSSLPQVVGDAGVMINPYNADELAGALEELIRDEGHRKELSKKGIDQAGSFSWTRTGKETWNVYEEVAQMQESK